ncbi:MAG TPA: type II toxin-antitoxin system RelE/ParE family toxin [Acidobacteriota bacterium]|nr:type II toxin-antitoxin system RelE/ParE family toxin [Acidobacteriota bacterium]
MARFRVYIKPSAQKDLESIPQKKERRRIVARIERLAEDPRPRGCRKLSGRDRYRIRQGKYRILYEIENDKLAVIVVKIGHRREAYRIL